MIDPCDKCHGDAKAAAQSGAGAMIYNSSGCHQGCPFIKYNLEDEWCAHPRAPKGQKRYYLPITGATRWCPRRGLETVVPALPRLREENQSKALRE